ncbi:MAG: toll/interleukin-1 receptor domain-containing protein [Candidatus Solibacter sp.]|nr:toll/interleukin-1 receptor domain-containing protein [Candidatus Solibacter sp.]
MQTLTAPTIFPCYAAADRALAERLAALLERGADVRVFLDEGQMPDGADLAEKAREARMADIVLVLFSRNSLPSRWPRAQWEDALVKEPAAEGVRIAFLKCHDCIPPKVLTPMFDAARLRDVKRWVRGSEAGEPPAAEFSADLEVLGIALADRPGTETVPGIALAREFARGFASDFDAVLRLDCATGTLADMAGDLAWQMGLHLEGELTDNLEHLRIFCSARRFLVLLEGAAPADLIFGGRCSTLISTEPGEPSPDGLRQLARAFDAVEDWTEACRLARQARRVAHDQFRLAECFEIMTQWRAMAEEHDDRPVVDEASRELVWILDGWGRTEEARQLEQSRAMEFDEQLPLFFE